MFFWVGNDGSISTGREDEDMASRDFLLTLGFPMDFRFFLLRLACSTTGAESVKDST